jgi:hypothetical protein
MRQVQLSQEQAERCKNKGGAIPPCFVWRSFMSEEIKEQAENEVIEEVSEQVLEEVEKPFMFQVVPESRMSEECKLLFNIYKVLEEMSGKIDMLSSKLDSNLDSKVLIVESEDEKKAKLAEQFPYANIYTPNIPELHPAIGLNAKEEKKDDNTTKNKRSEANASTTRKR